MGPLRSVGGFGGAVGDAATLLSIVFGRWRHLGEALTGWKRGRRAPVPRKGKKGVGGTAERGFPLCACRLWGTACWGLLEKKEGVLGGNQHSFTGAARRVWGCGWVKEGRVLSCIGRSVASRERGGVLPLCSPEPPWEHHVQV